MDDVKDAAGGNGLQFFGQISASVSHDIKNYFSIINENAGLLSDLVFMSEKGKPIDPERIKKIAGSIQNQIRLADKVVRSMNSFSHSVDKPFTTIDLVEDLHLIASLNRRFCSMKRVTITVDSDMDALLVTARRFLLLHLLSHCIRASIHGISADRQLIIHIEQKEQMALIRFSGIADFDSFNKEWLNETGKKLLVDTSAKTSYVPESEAMEILINISRSS